MNVKDTFSREKLSSYNNFGYLSIKRRILWMLIILVIDFFHKYPILKLIMNMNGN